MSNDVLKFSDFIKENDTDKNTDKDVKKYIDSKVEECPRCGERIEKCSCEEDDSYSTHNSHRAPKGKIIKPKPKQEFKK